MHSTGRYANRRYSAVKGIKAVCVRRQLFEKWNLISICRIGWYQELPWRSICYRGRRSGRNWCWASSTNATWKIRQQPRLPAVSPSNFPPFADFNRDYLIKSIQVVEAAAEIPVPSGCVESFTRSDGPFDHSELCVEYESFRAVSYGRQSPFMRWWIIRGIGKAELEDSGGWDEEETRRLRKFLRYNSEDAPFRTNVLHEVSQIPIHKDRFSLLLKLEVLETSQQTWFRRRFTQGRITIIPFNSIRSKNFMHSSDRPSHLSQTSTSYPNLSFEC